MGTRAIALRWKRIEGKVSAANRACLFYTLLAVRRIGHRWAFPRPPEPEPYDLMIRDYSERRAVPRVRRHFRNMKHHAGRTVNATREGVAYFTGLPVSRLQFPATLESHLSEGAALCQQVRCVWVDPSSPLASLDLTRGVLV